ncbi:CL17A protein, partial [Cochlearius cochlearius]|nr:CL17A protein [Cochlearius cochlearius]
IYSVAGKMTPMGDFRPASPDSFEDDYDDVSLSESDRGCKPAVAHENLQGQKSKGGTGSTHLSPQRRSRREPPQGRVWPKTTPKPSPSSRRMTSVAVLYGLVVLSFVAWVLLFTLAMMKQVEIMAELKLLRSNYSENQANVQQGLLEMQREQTRLRSGMQKYYEELRDVTAVICRSVPESRKCSVGWKIFKKSCYSFSTEAMSWWDAKETCVDQGAHLVTVNSEQEQVRRVLV